MYWSIESNRMSRAKYFRLSHSGGRRGKGRERRTIFGCIDRSTGTKVHPSFHFISRGLYFRNGGCQGRNRNFNVIRLPTHLHWWLHTPVHRCLDFFSNCGIPQYHGWWWLTQVTIQPFYYLFFDFFFKEEKRKRKMKIGSERGEARRYFCFTRDISFCLLDK